MSEFENLAESVYEALDMATNIEANVELSGPEEADLEAAYAHLRLAFSHIEEIIRREE